MRNALRKATHDIPTQVKNQALVQRRRRQIVDAAVELFIQHGFHNTTTRQIAAAAGFSIESVYEYVASKEDIFYLVCDAIHAEIETGTAEAIQIHGGYGSTKDYAVERNYRDARFFTIYEGTPQIQRVVISNHILKDKRRP